MKHLRLLLGGWALSLLLGSAAFFPLEQVRPGMKATGKTVFQGDRVEQFDVEILGVLENAGPQQSLILARLSGGPLDTAGVLQGMSGSPVFVGGQLLGAVAMAFSYSKEPIAAIRPIGDLLRASRQSASSAPLARRVSLFDTDLTRAFPPPGEVIAGSARLVEIATPLSFAGFTRSCIERFAPRLRALGFEPQQGISGGGHLPDRMGDPAHLQPGSMISILLLTGDMSVGADGTVTYIDGQRVYAFGHRLLSLGATEIPFARAEVLTVVPNLSTSFKISAPREWMGTIVEDRSTGVVGELGRKARMVPVTITVRGQERTAARSGSVVYRMQMVDDALLSPLLIQMAVSSVVEATERAVGDATVQIRGEIQFEPGVSPLRIRNSYAGSTNLPDQASQAAAVPLAYALQNAPSRLRLKQVELEIECLDERRELRVAQVWTTRREVRPGEAVDVMFTLAGPDGLEMTRSVTYRVPVGAKTGPLYFTVSDASTANTADFRQFLETPPRNLGQLLDFLNGLRNNTRAYVRVWRAEPGYTAGGTNFPSPPPSVGQILSRLEPPTMVLTPAQGSRVDELEVDTGGYVVSGSKTVVVEVKE